MNVLKQINPYSFIDKNSKNKISKISRHLSFNSTKKTSKNQNIKNLKISLDNNNNNNSVLNKTTTIFQKAKVYNKILKSESSIDNIIKFLDKELTSINKEKYVNDIIKMFQIFQEELIIQLKNKCNDLKINQVMKNNFEIIIKYILNIFSNYQNKYKDYLMLIKNKINSLTKKEKINNSIINN